MATSENIDLIAPDLVSIISNYPYRCYFQYMSSKESVTDEMYSQMELSKTHWVDKRNCHKVDGSRNASAIFDMFGVFSNKNGMQVREDMIKHVELEGKLYASVGQIVLGMRCVTLETWCNEMRDSNQFPDELAIYALSRMYNRHMVVLCHKRFWTTLETSTSLTQQELFQACHMQLVYMGCELFGELKHKPFSGEIPNPITLDNLAAALASIKGKGRTRKQPINLSVGHIQLPATTNSTVLVPVEPNQVSHDHTNSENQKDTLADHDTAADQSTNFDGVQPAAAKIDHDAGKLQDEPSDAAVHQPLIQIPRQYWLHQILQEKYYGETDVNTDDMKGRNKNEENVKGRNSDSEEPVLQDAVPNPLEKVEELSITSAKKRKCYIPLERLQPDVIKCFCPSERSPSIDPYSSLEDIGSDNEDIGAPVENRNKVCDEKKIEEPTNYPPVTHSHTSYFMRSQENKRRRSMRPQRNCAVINYAELISQDSGDDEPKKKTRKPKVTTEPSKDRITAQNVIIAHDKPKHRPPKPLVSGGHGFFRKDPAKAKPRHRKPVPIKTEHETTEDLPDPNNDEDVKPSTSKADAGSSPPKGKFETKEHGLKKHKEVRYFNCPKCGIHKTTVMKLNEHYKRRHAPLKCDKCTMSFSTPSGLTRHRYIHSTPWYPCLDCLKTFHFSSELKTHRVVHLKVKAHFCNCGNCGKSFMNKPDLLKHVCEHDAKPMTCDKCKYTTKNPWLLKSHVLSHTDEKPYSCYFCADKFKYRTQLHRHREICPMRPAKSISPDY